MQRLIPMLRLYVTKSIIIIHVDTEKKKQFCTYIFKLYYLFVESNQNSVDVTYEGGTGNTGRLVMGSCFTFIDSTIPPMKCKYKRGYYNKKYMYMSPGLHQENPQQIPS